MFDIPMKMPERKANDFTKLRRRCKAECSTWRRWVIFAIWNRMTREKTRRNDAVHQRPVLVKYYCAVRL